MTKEEQIREQVKRKLYKYTDVRDECRQIADQLQQLETTITSPRVQALDGPGGGDAMTSLVAELVGLQEKYKAKLHRLNAALAEVEDLIGALDDPVERSLMRCRYIEGKVWEEVCVDLGYSW